MANKAEVWAKQYLRELAKHPVNGELSIGDILYRYYKYQNQNYSVKKAAQIDSNLMIDSGRTIRRISISENLEGGVVQYNRKSGTKKFKAKARELSAILEKSENILTRGKKRGRTYRHKNARPMLTDRAIASLVPKLLEAIGIEVRWMQIHPLVESMVMEFHRSCEDNPDLWIEQLSNPLIFVVDQNDLQVSLVDGRRRLQFSFQTEGLTLDDITPYKNEFHTRIEDWVPNVYTRGWLSTSSANIQRLLSQGGLVCEGSKRGRWIYRDNLPSAILESRITAREKFHKNDSETVVTHTRDGLWTIISKQENLFNQFNEQSKPLNEADRATALILKEQLKAQLKTLELSKVTRELISRQKTLRASVDDEDSSHDTVLIINIDRLRKWRLKEARKIKMPAYHIFSDTTMEELAIEMPRTEEELLLVRGIGPGKVDDFGSELLEFLQELSKSTAAAAV